MPAHDASLRVATWNINSLRLRVGLLDKLVEALDPDVICLQETKVPDALFPARGAGSRWAIRTPCSAA